jgi:hypothetical protein
VKKARQTALLTHNVGLDMDDPSVMPNTWIIDITHYLDEHGAIVTAPAPARRLAEHFAAIVRAVTCEPCEAAIASIVRCRRRPGRKPCPGQIRAAITLDDQMNIAWECPSCGDKGLISNWHGTIWDCLEADADDAS